MIDVFFDTTFLMPFFGLETSIPDLSEQLKFILTTPELTIFFSAISIIEIKWQFLKLVKQGHNQDELEQFFSNAISAIKDDKRFEIIDFFDNDINNLSYELLKLGHTDYFDTVIASSALYSSDYFLSLDEPLKKKLNLLLSRKNEFKIRDISMPKWEEFFKNISTENNKKKI